MHYEIGSKKHVRKAADKYKSLDFPLFFQIEILGYLKKVHNVPVGSVKILTQYNAQRHQIEQRLKALSQDRTQDVFDRQDVANFVISTVVSSQGQWHLQGQ